jgi:hypothetical protein
MPVSEPLPHFDRRRAGVPARDSPHLRDARRRSRARRSARRSQRQSVEAESRALSGYLRRLDDIHPDGLTPIENSNSGWCVEPSRADVRERGGPDLGANPQHYADLIASSLAGQALFTYAPPPTGPAACSRSCVRCRASSGRARQRQGSAGHLRQGRRRVVARRLKFVEQDLPRAFAMWTTCICSAICRRADRSDSRDERLRLVPRNRDRAARRASFRLGREKFEQKLRLEEGCRCRSIGCWRSRSAS